MVISSIKFEYFIPLFIVEDVKEPEVAETEPQKSTRTSRSAKAPEPVASKKTSSRATKKPEPVEEKSEDVKEPEIGKLSF